MSLITITKDHIETLNTTFGGVLDIVNLQTLTQQASLFLFSATKSLVLYLLTFQWLRDLACFPLRVPEISRALVREHLVIEIDRASFDLFAFLQPAVSSNNKLFTGLLNSFFLSLPLSASHLIAVRRLLIQGIPAGIAAGLGAVLGHWWLVTSVVFGLRFVTVPWFSSEPFAFVVGLYLTTSVVYDMTHQRSLSLIKGFERSKLIRVFLLSFALCWTEQACVFQSFSSFSLDPKSSPLELYSSNSFLAHLTYSAGLLIGSVFFTALFGLSLLWLFRFLPTRLGLRFSRWVNLFNSGFLSLIFAFAVAATPYYGFDYLVAKPLGFLSEDKSWLKANNIFSPDIDVLSRWTEEDPDNQGPFPDLKPFQRTQYVGDVDADNPRTYEQHNFGGEYAANTIEVRNGSNKTISEAGRESGRAMGLKMAGFFNLPVEKTVYGPRVQTEPSVSARPEHSGQAGRPAEGSRQAVNQPFQRDRFADVEGPLDFDVPLDGGGGPRVRRSGWHRALQESVDELYEATLEVTDDEPDAEPDLVGVLRNRYYSNPLYKLLLSTEIDFFVGRQQSRSALSPDAEADLFDKRLKLAGYYNTLRAYNQLGSLSAEGESYNLENLFQGPKSYATHVYNQQFKGTLRIVRRLFSLTLPPQEGDNGTQEGDNGTGNSGTGNNGTQKGVFERVLKFDQPLFRDRDLRTRHEELTGPLEGMGSDPERRGPVGGQVEAGPETKSGGDDRDRFFDEAVGLERGERVKGVVALQGDCDRGGQHYNYRKGCDYEEGWGWGEDWNWGGGVGATKTQDLFVRGLDSTPLYAGWDQEGRRSVLTNFLLPRMVAGREVRGTSQVLNQSQSVLFPGLGSKKVIETAGASSKEVQAIGFTTWPLKGKILSKNVLDENISTDNNPYQLFFESSDNPRNAEFIEDTEFWELHRFLKENKKSDKNEKIPPNYIRFYPPYLKFHTEVEEIIPPSRGGFVWPGSLKPRLVESLKG